ncbi:mannosyl-oligosaccharide alpha-1,2-mannosidase [Tyrophagus putrescentiae]|nr:mannosyl-oligosaccharide alpha-1,2-mannosidase [Tyrophagus putrescentiae]
MAVLTRKQAPQLEYTSQLNVGTSLSVPQAKRNRFGTVKRTLMLLSTGSAKEKSNFLAFTVNEQADRLRKTYQFVKSMNDQNCRFGGITYLAQSYFFLYRQTGDEKYREWAWELAQAINKHCRTENGGFSSLKNVDSVPAEMSDNQPANLFSSTFKYLYLIFSNQSVLPLDKWIFNRRGSPLPICVTNCFNIL